MPKRARGLAQPRGNRPRIRWMRLVAPPPLAAPMDSPAQSLDAPGINGRLRENAGFHSWLMNAVNGKARNEGAWTAAVAGGKAFPCAPDDLKEENP